MAVDKYSSVSTVTHSTTNKQEHRDTNATIIDIRKDREEFSILQDIKTGLRPESGNGKTLPTLLLYDVNGLQLFEKITYLQEYYLTNTEIEVLERYAENIAQKIKPNSIILELGSGNLRKIEILLSAIDRLGKAVGYYALDLSLDELQRTLSAVPQSHFKHVKCYGLHGTYDDGLEWLKTEEIRSTPKAVLSLGSSIGNFKKPDAAAFLKSFANTLQHGDCFLVGIDACSDPMKVFHAYNDVEGVTHEFIKNGLEHANQLLGSKDFNTSTWKVFGEYRYNEQGGGHVAFVSPTRDVSIDGVTIKKDEKIQIEESNKFSKEETEEMLYDAGLVLGAKWTNQAGDYALHMSYKPAFSFSSKAAEYASNPVPSVDDWQSLWSVWDVLTRHMIPHEELEAKPIKLRNACIFYLGHIPTFLDIHISKATGVWPKELEYYQKIFERGIDPDVDNPEVCHDHSEVPNTWPPVGDIIVYQAQVRERVKLLFNSGEAESKPSVRKALWLGFEHEAMHLETLLYMLVQSERTVPPPGVVEPDFETLSAEAASNVKEEEWVKIPVQTISIGLDDPDQDIETPRYFGWDNEKPPRNLDVHSFLVRSKPITNGEYAKFLESSGKQLLPASWTVSKPETNGTNGHAKHETNVGTNGITNGVKNLAFIDGKSVRTVFGKVPLRFALDWPVMASYDELTDCAQWMNGRIPTMEEVKSIYQYVDDMKPKEIGSRSENIPAVNGHLSNDGVEETPPSKPYMNGSSGAHAKLSPNSLFVDLKNANVGFKNWHPLPVDGAKLAGQSELGGVWEWTSTILEKHDGFQPMKLYPGYTADFFDGKHNIVLGGSWATHPRLAGRKSFVNWYQRNYPYVWAGSRLVRDVE